MIKNSDGIGIPVTALEGIIACILFDRPSLAVVSNGTGTPLQVGYLLPPVLRQQPGITSEQQKKNDQYVLP
jgi:hypothetical protein